MCDDTSLEDYIRTLTDFDSVLDKNGTLKEDTNAEKCLKIMRKCLKGSAKISFLEALADVRGANATLSTYLEFKESMAKTSSEILGQDAFEKQIEYLKNTKKPKKLTVEEWMRKIKNINFNLPVIDSSEKAIEDKILLRDVIMPNIPMTTK